MYQTDLYKTILVDPIDKDVDTLNIVSGYATAAMAFHHLSELINNKPELKVNLILGMCVRDGLSESNHKGFQSLMTGGLKDNFECTYLMNLPPAHSKIYIWSKQTTPKIAYLGSANYTQTAFIKSQRELMNDCDPVEGYKYYNNLYSQSIYCNHIDAENYVTIYKDNAFKRIKTIESQIHESEEISDLSGLDRVRISLYSRDGELPKRSGLNWGQRPKYHRDPNQAYIRIPISIARTKFFPERGVHFTLLTDDGKILICTRAQDYGKAIHTPHNNSLIGEYFRNRLNLANGQLITKKDVEKYGRNYIDIYKIDDETFYLDFSKINSG